MVLREITSDGVRQAIGEFDLLGRDAFLELYGFGRSRRFLLRHDDKVYDSKAIAGVAHRYGPEGLALAASEFSGGADHTVAVLRALASRPSPAIRRVRTLS